MIYFVSYLQLFTFFGVFELNNIIVFLKLRIQAFS